LRSKAAHSGGYVCGLLSSFCHAQRSVPGVDALARRERLPDLDLT
jgi:hypothetical protein